MKIFEKHFNIDDFYNCELILTHMQTAYSKENLIDESTNKLLDRDNDDLY